MGDKERLEALARKIAQALNTAQSQKPKLRAVRSDERAPEARPDPISRHIVIARIRDVTRLYNLHWLLRQETEHVRFCVEDLTDPEISALRDLVERARECCVEGICFDDANIIRKKG